MRRKPTRRWLASATMLAAATMVAAGCSSAGGSTSAAGPTSAGSATSGGGATSGDAGSAAKAVVTPPPTIAPTTIYQTTPLPEKPPTGKSIGIVGPNLPLETYIMKHMNTAAGDLGWTTKTYLYGATVTAAAAVQQAINGKPDYLIFAGLDTDTLKPQMAAAKAAGIPVIGFQDYPATSAPANDYYNVDADYSPWFLPMVNWIINKSGGKASIVNVTLPEFPEYVKTAAIVKSHIQQTCPGCSYAELDMTVNDMTGGKVPSIVASYLQSHPDVNYAMFTVGDMMPGVQQALQAAGLLSRVTITGVAPDQAQLESVAAGDNQAWSAYATVGFGYVPVDLIARLTTGVKVTQSMLQEPTYSIGASPIWVVDSPAQAKLIETQPFGWNGPSDTDAQYRKLWHIG